MLLKKMNGLPKAMADFIRFAGSLADETQVRAYAVGGFVRDLFLGVDNFDVDLVIEGDGIGFAAESSRRLGLRIIAHKRFGTATLEGLPGFKVDIASARKEIYEKPAVLPTVFRGTIEDDLSRRDFTINAMALCINKHRFGYLVDCFAGQSDLKRGRLRALHRLSFIDDPTRILRAVRFEQRFDFKIEKDTMAWLKESVRRRMLHHVQKHRLRDELVLMFKEDEPLKPLKRLYGICGFSFVSPRLRFQSDWPGVFAQVAPKARWFKKRFFHKRHLEPYIMCMSLFFYPLSAKEIKKVMLAFAFHKGESSRILSFKEKFSRVDKGLGRERLRPSAVYQLLEPLSYEAILSMMILSKDQKIHQRIREFLNVSNGQRLHIRGEDLGKIGIKPGPHYKKILSELLYAKIDGRLKSREDELDLAQKLAHER